MPKPSKRDQPVEATKELLWEVGYEAMSPRDIQARSGVKSGSLYHHFPSEFGMRRSRWARLRRRRSHVLEGLSADTRRWRLFATI
jgi:AcrR family transcriptional regulator